MVPSVAEKRGFTGVAMLFRWALTLSSDSKGQAVGGIWGFESVGEKVKSRGEEKEMEKMRARKEDGEDRRVKKT